MDRKEFLANFGKGALALVFVPACIGGLSSCKKTDLAPTNVDFTVDISTGSLAKNGGYLVKNGVIVARTNSGSFLAVSAACTHEGTTVNYVASNNDFYCPNHGAKFDNTGKVTNGPASKNLSQYTTSLDGNILTVKS